MPTRVAYHLHGYRLLVPTGLDLPAPSADEHGGASTHPSAPGEPAVGGTLDVALAARRPIPADPPDGEPLAALPGADGPLYSFARSADELVLRFHGYAEIVGDRSLRNASAFLHPGIDEAVLAVLLPGTVMAVRLMLDGHLVLHASAVERDGAAVAFAGPSGSGKSTLAALGVLAGLRLVTDDVLRVELDAPAGAGVQVWPGAVAVRLRPDVAHLADLATATASGPPARHRSAVPARTTADGRLALPAGEVAGGPIPLRHIVLPRLSQDAERPRVRRLDAVSAAQRLLLAPRVLGWTYPDQLLQQFERTVELCERVDVVELDVPAARRGDPTVVPESLDLMRDTGISA